MKNVLLNIKKFFAIIISILFGVFKNDNKVDNYDKQDETLDKDSLSKQRKTTTRIIRDDEESTKKIREESSKKNDEDIVYYAKKDIQKLIYIKKRIAKLDYQINNCDSLEEIFELQKELEKIKYHFEKVFVYYEKIDVDEKIINDIKSIGNECSTLIKQEEKQINKKEKEISKKEKDLESEELEKEEETEKDDELEEIEIQEDEKESEKEKANDEKEKKDIDSLNILDSIVIKDITDIVSETKKEDSKEDFKEIKSVDKVEANIDSISNDTTVVTVEKKDSKKIRTDVINKAIVLKSVKDLNASRKNQNIAAISAILAQAHAIASSVNPATMLQVNPTAVVSSVLYVNNEIRRARSLTGKKVKKMKLDKVIRTIGTNPLLQVRSLMTNSLSEIRKLKNELRQYGMSDEVINALNELNELEMELVMQLNELQLQNNLNNTRHR